MACPTCLQLSCWVLCTPAAPASGEGEGAGEGEPAAGLGKGEGLAGAGEGLPAGAGGEEGAGLAGAGEAPPPPQRQEERAEARAVATAGWMSLLMLWRGEEGAREGWSQPTALQARVQHSHSKLKVQASVLMQVCRNWAAACALPLAALTLAFALAAAEANFCWTACELACAWLLQPVLAGEWSRLDSEMAAISASMYQYAIACIQIPPLGPPLATASLKAVAVACATDCASAAPEAEPWQPCPPVTATCEGGSVGSLWPQHVPASK